MKRDGLFFGSLVLVVWMLGLALFTSFQLPERVPVHFDFGGKIDRWGARDEGIVSLFVPPTIVVFTLVVLDLVSRARNIKDDRVTPVMFFCIGLLLSVVQWFEARAMRISGGELPAQWIFGGVGLVLVVTGSLLPKIDPKTINGFEYAKRSAIAWQATVQGLSRAFMVLGLGIALLGFVHNVVIVLTITLFLPTALILGLGLLESRSHKLWRTDPNREELQR